MQLRFHMAVVVRALALELGTAKQAMFAPQQRRTLFENLANWCEDGTETSQGADAVCLSLRAAVHHGHTHSDVSIDPVIALASAHQCCCLHCLHVRSEHCMMVRLMLAAR